MRIHTLKALRRVAAGGAVASRSASFAAAGEWVRKRDAIATAHNGPSVCTRNVREILRGAALVAVAGCAACCGSTERGNALQRAGTYERGDGVPRDYAVAAEILSVACRGGAGDPAACRRLAEAIRSARGVQRGTDVDVMGLFVAACQHGDWLACANTDTFDRSRAEAACRGSKKEACVTLAATTTGDGSSAEHTRRQYLEAACGQGVLTACIRTLMLEGRDGSVVARAAVASACQRGDADACNAIGEPVAAHDLCAAHDYQACAMVGLEGDESALVRACEARVPIACEHIAIRARDADPADATAPEKLAFACKSGSEVACRYNSRVADVANGCAAYQPLRIPPRNRIVLPRLVGTRNGADWIDTNSQPRLLFGGGFSGSADELAILTERLPGVRLIIQASGGTTAAGVEVVQLAPGLQDTSLVPPRDPSAVRLGTLGDGNIKVVDSEGKVRAVLSEESGIVPATLARCVHTLLNDP